MKRSWFQFRLKTLFLLLTLAAIATGVFRHVRYVSERIQFHEVQLEDCNEKLTVNGWWVTPRMRYLSLPTWEESQTQSDSEPDESERIQQAIDDRYLLFYGPERAREIAFDARQKSLAEEISLIETAQRYHQMQLESYRRAIWRPWQRVVEDPSQELSSLLPESESQHAVPSAPPVPQVLLPTDDQPKQTLLQLEISPQLPEITPEFRRPWQSIDRPLPRDFDNRNVQMEKPSAA